MSNNPELTLSFEGGDSPQLAGSIFYHPAVGRVLRSFRGIVPVVSQDSGTFPWTSGVKALCILVVKTKLSALQDPDRAGFVMTGDRGSLARAFDSALSKSPNWLLDMLGTTSSGETFARRLIRRGNPEQKRPGPVLITIHRAALPPESLIINLDGQRLESVPMLERLARALESPTDEQPQREAPASLPPSAPPSAQQSGANSVQTFQTNPPKEQPSAVKPSALSIRDLLGGLPSSIHGEKLDALLNEIQRHRSTLVVLEDDAAGIQLTGGIPSILEHSTKNIQWLLSAAARSGIGFMTLPSRRSTAKEAHEMFKRAAHRLAEVTRGNGHSITWATRFDSCLRGHITPEMSAVEQALVESGIPAFDLQVYAPSFYQGGRITLNGIQMSRRGEQFVPLAETEYSRIPGFEYDSSYVHEVVNNGLTNAAT
ncbi:MAG: hypothetical protein EBZ48_08555, partial [Proteobacteria bacterium]|nr:hypothetical protein [Pseudomonadota bacterium]